MSAADLSRLYTVQGDGRYYSLDPTEQPQVRAFHSRRFGSENISGSCTAEEVTNPAYALHFAFDLNDYAPPFSIVP